MDDARAVLDGIDAPLRRCLELAWESWCAGSIGVGAVVVDDRTGAIVSEGRNRVGERDAPPNTLAGTALAHAEMNALAQLPLGPVGHLTLHTSLEPCCLCAGAVALMRIPRVRYLAPDPLFDAAWDHMATHPELASRRPEQLGPGTGPASDLARLLPLSFLAFWDVATLADYSAADVDMAHAVLADTPLLDLAAAGAPLADALGAVASLLR
jgi:tRNA(Arg) A34 adenosine deaminase TadA